jgi:hypothetical protein
MSRRARQNTSVSLFPFLAVLLCAMGALLVLLVITTRQIREDAIRVAEEKKSQPIVKQKAKPAQEEWPDWSIDLGESTLLATRKHPQPAAAPLQAPKPIYEKTEGTPAPPDLSAGLKRLRAKLNRLQETQSGASADVKMIVDQTTAIQTEIIKREKILKYALTAMDQIKKRDQQTSAELNDLQQKTLQLSQDLQAKRAKNQKLANAPRNTPNVLKVVPYEGQSGTTRRPILIECTAGIIRFVPEGIELKERDLVGFSVQDNPLLSGVLAAEEYWMKRDQSVGDINRPYVLIVVRPDGIPAYYGARQLLQNYKQRFGYELVDQDQKLASPQIDPVAQTAIQRAVDENIKKRGAPPRMAQALFPSYDPRELEQTLSGGSLSGDRIGGTLNDSSSGDSRPNGMGQTGSGKDGEQQKVPDRRFKFVQTSQGLVKVPLIDADMKSFRRNDGSSTGSERGFKSTTGPNNDGPTEPKLIKPGIPSAGSRQITEFPRSTTNRTDRPSGEPLSGTGSQTTTQGANSQNDSQNISSGEPTSQSASAERLSSLPANAPDALTPILQERARQLANGTGQGESNNSSGQNDPQTSQGEGGASSSGQPGSPGQGRGRPSQPVKKMPFERPLRVAISDRGLRVDERDAIALPSNLKTQQLMNLTVEELRNRVKEWPAPPEQFYWRPMVKFYVYPNGQKNYERLKPYFEKQGLLSDVKYVESIPNQEGSRN